ncbi:MAG TPA: DMT family transporter [Pyrinomonadaceae bacterium]|nr:DMT family transporter [Pyrinomonadaceae bacterium]
MRLKTNLGADAAILVTTVIWGSTFAVARDILDHWPPLAYLALRLGLATLVFAALFPRQLARAGGAAWRAGAALGLLIGVGFLGQTAGLLYTTPAKSAFITGLTTPLVPFVAFLLTRARPSRENMIGVVLASLGGALILAPAGAEGFNTGDLVTLSTTLLFATHITLLGRFARRFDARQLSVLQIGVAAALLGAAWGGLRLYAAAGGQLAPALARELEPLVWGGRAAWQLVYLSLVATVITFLLWTWGQARMSATHAAIIFSLEPVFATLFAVLVRGSAEWTGGRATAGALLVVAGVIASELRWGSRRPRDEDEEGGEATAAGAAAID